MTPTSHILAPGTRVRVESRVRMICSREPNAVGHLGRVLCRNHGATGSWYWVQLDAEAGVFRAESYVISCDALKPFQHDPLFRYAAVTEGNLVVIDEDDDNRVVVL